MDTELVNTLEGRLVGLAGKALVAHVDVWFSYRTVEGQEHRVTTRSAEDGTFSFPLPGDALSDALVGLDVEGATPVDLEPAGRPLEPGDLTVVIDDLLPNHLRYAG